jgi:DNA invertase Pin-like site-specific DNA recombinase
VAEVFVDNDVSAYSGKRRPAFDAMVTAFKDGRLDGLVIWHPDRLARSAREIEDIIDMVEATGIAVGTVTSADYDLTTPDGRLVARIVGAVARKESEDKSRRIRRKHVELADAGKLSGGGRRPFGYRSDRLTIHAGEAKLIREAVDRVLAGEPVRAVARDWERRGIKTPEGSTWAARNLRRTLLGGRIAGLRDHSGGNSVPAVWPGIITPEQHVRLVAILTDPRRVTRGRGISYLLSGFVTCGQCGNRLSARPTAEHVRKYSCIAGPGLAGCGRCVVVAEPLEKLVEDAVVDRLCNPVMARTLASRAKAAKKGRKGAVDSVEELEARRGDLADQWANGSLSTAMLERMSSALDRQLADARSAVVQEVTPRPVAAIIGDPADVAKRWGQLDFARRRAVIGAVIDSIVIGPARRGYNKFDSSRVSVTWAM